MMRELRSLTKLVIAHNDFKVQTRNCAAVTWRCAACDSVLRQRDAAHALPVAGCVGGWG